MERASAPPVFRVPRRFAEDFAYLTGVFAWDAADVREIKDHLRRHRDEMIGYWTAMATALRDGYTPPHMGGTETMERFRAGGAAAGAPQC